jgi:hypothetical protein
MKTQYATNIVRMPRRGNSPWAVPRLLVAACAAGALATGCNGGTVDRHALRNDSNTLASIATEGQLLANDVAKGASTSFFARVHAGELAGQASSFEDALSKRPTSPGIEAKVRRASRLAGRIAAHLDELHAHPKDRAVARRVQRELADDADAAEQLAK